MQASQLGQEIRRLRLRAGYTLRGLAAKLKISAAHQSDIERNLRRPSETLLKSIVQELRPVGATIEAFARLVTGVDPETRDWLASTPGVRELLRAVRESGLQPTEVLRLLEKRIIHKKSVKARISK